MEKQKKSIGLLAKLAFKAAESTVNSASPIWIYQPKLPEKVKSLRKF
jgi:cyclic lactone autoinducer peptide